MVSFDKLAELSSGNVGFVGGSSRDMMPNMGLTESIDAFSMYLMESVIADYDREQARDDRMFEAAMDAISLGDMTILEAAMNEADEESAEADPADKKDSSGSAGKKTVWERIKAQLKKIWEWIKSLFSKVGMWISRVTKDGASFYAKYKDKMNKPKLGVKIKLHTKILSANSLSDIIKVKGIGGGQEAVIKELDSRFVSIGSASGKSKEELKSLASAMGDVTTDQIKKAVYKIAGISDIGNKKVLEYLIGEKKEEHSTVAGDVNVVKKILIDSTSLKGIQSSYKAMMDKAQGELRAAQAQADMSDNGMTEYANAYTRLFRAVTGELNKLNSASVKAAKIAIGDSKRLMIALATGKSSDGEASDEKDAEKAAASNADSVPEEEFSVEESFGFDDDFDFNF